MLSFSLTCIFSLWNDLNNQIYSRSSLLQFKLGRVIDSFFMTQESQEGWREQMSLL